MVHYKKCSTGCPSACKQVSHFVNFEKCDKHLLVFPLLPCMDCCLEICPPSFSCSQCVRVLYWKFSKDFLYKTMLLTTINCRGTCRVLMFSVQFVAEFSGMKFYPVIQSKTHLVPQCIPHYHCQSTVRRNGELCDNLCVIHWKWVQHVWMCQTIVRLACLYSLII